MLYWLVYLWKVSLRIRDQQARLPAPAIADHHKLLAVFGGCRDVGSRARGGADGTVTPSCGSPVAVVASEEGLGAVLSPEVVEILHCGDGHACLWNDNAVAGTGKDDLWNENLILICDATRKLSAERERCVFAGSSRWQPSRNTSARSTPASPSRARGTVLALLIALPRRHRPLRLPHDNTAVDAPTLHPRVQCDQCDDLEACTASTPACGLHATPQETGSIRTAVVQRSNG